MRAKPHLLFCLGMLGIVGVVACEAPAKTPPDAPRVQSSAVGGEACALPPLVTTAKPDAKNVLGAPLEVCSTAPLTGWFRDGRCATGEDDTGVHVVCSEVTDAFLEFSKAHGNDLITPRGAFPGLTRGSRWCLCASRWREAANAGVAPPVVLEATDEAALRVNDLATMQAHQLSRALSR